MAIQATWWLISTHLCKKHVKLDHFRGENKTSVKPPRQVGVEHLRLLETSGPLVMAGQFFPPGRGKPPP